MSVLAVRTVLAQNGCPTGLGDDASQQLNYDGNCYFFSTEAVTYSQANSNCGANNGYLAVIVNDATQRTLYTRANDIADLTGRSSYWIGLQKLVNSATVTTILGDSTHYNSFGSTGGDGTGQTGCVQMNLEQNGAWYTADCSSNLWSNGYICQFKGSAVNIRPIPGMIIALLLMYFILNQ